MSVQHIADLLLQYRYWLLIPLSILEGPVVCFLAGSLAASGYFNIYLLGFYFLYRDLFMDTLFYSFGFYGSKSNLVQRFMKRFNISKSDITKVKQAWEKYPARTMFIGKLSYGLAAMFIALAGTVHMRLKKFYTYGMLVAVSQYWILLILGYFFGRSMHGTAANIVQTVEYLTAGATFFAAVYYFFTWFIRRTFHHKIIQK